MAITNQERIGKAMELLRRESQAISDCWWLVSNAFEQRRRPILERDVYGPNPLPLDAEQPNATSATLSRHRPT